MGEQELFNQQVQGWLDFLPMFPADPNKMNHWPKSDDDDDDDDWGKRSKGGSFKPIHGAGFGGAF